MTAERVTLAALRDAIDRFRLADADCRHPLADQGEYERRDEAVAAIARAAGVRVAPSDKDPMEGVACDWDEDGNCRCVRVAPSPDAPEPLSVREDVRSAAWNYLALLDRHRVEFHQDKCPERGNFPLWYQHKASSADRVEAALQRLRDALATSAMVGVGDFEDDGETPVRMIPEVE